MVQATLNGFLPPEFDTTTTPLIDLTQPPVPRPRRDYGAIEISNARSGEPLSEAERFARDGFVILPHATQVGDWDADIGSVYLPEIETIIRNRLFPGVRVDIQQRPNLVRRGRGTNLPYANESIPTGH